MKQSDDNKLIPMTSVDSGKVRKVTDDVSYFTNQIVNVAMITLPTGEWILVDAGMPKSSKNILKAVEEVYGENKPPLAIILTHGHFDHVGSIVDLLNVWNVPVYAHALEFPFLTGKQAYPEPDTSVQGGMLAKISSLYPNEPIDITEVLKELPIGGTVPHLSDWEWIHSPGHSPGQIVLYRHADGLLISADAIITVRQDAMYNVLVQKKEVCGPPVYLTTDWENAYISVQFLVNLQPKILLPGHGTVMEGDELREGMQRLVEEWDEIAMPKHGKWVDSNGKA